MILAAGLGTRLLPLTHVRPKVMIPVLGTPILDFWAERLRQCKFEAAILNAYHLKERVVEEVAQKTWPIAIEVHTEPMLLGTGGGIRTALESLGDDPFAVINGDIVCNAPIDRLYEEHVRSGAEVSLLLHDWPEFNNVAVDEEGSVLGFGKEAQRIRAGRNGVRMLAFTGIHFINPAALREYPRGAPADILDFYRRLISCGSPPRALFSPGLFWREMGSLESYRKLTSELGGLEENILPPIVTGRRVWIHPEATVSPGTELKGSVVIGRGTKILDGSRLEDVILWEDVRIEAASSLKGCIAADGTAISGRHSGKVFVPGRK
ncbi:MAG: NDP-sugar synthase [Syntrophobacteraceae bacterium]